MAPLTNILYVFVRALRLRGDAAGDPTAQTLHVLMLLLLSLTSTHVAFGTINHYNKPLILLVGIPMIVTPVLTLALLRKNAVRAAAIVYLVGMWIGFTAIIVLNGGIHHVGLAVYIALAVSAAWLFGYGAALWTAGACLACMLIVAILENEGLGPPRLLPGTPMGVWMLMIESTVMGVVPVSLILSSYREALSRSQHAEAELKAHEEQLEDLVQQRTAELVEAKDQAQTANRAKSAFLANMSHELRTPLNAILGFTTLVRQDPCVPEQRRQDLDIVTRSGEHLLSLIDDILDLAKIEAGRMALELRPVQLHELLRSTVDLMRARAEEKGLSLVLERSSTVPRFVQADAGKLREVLINLIGNAVKYTSRGFVAVKANAKEDGARCRLVVEVVDSGVGIAAEDHARIFDPFIQARQHSAQKGTGLGLAISRNFIELMGGSLTLESAPGCGSTFRVEVPLQLEDEPSAGVDAGANPQILRLALGQPDYRILIVEDHPENAMVLDRMLQAVGFSVRVAGDGLQAVEQFSSWRPHLIWMDLGLPGIDGLEAACRIRNCKGGTEVKIIAVTASAFAAEREAVLAEGLDGFLRKPYRYNEIFDCMADLLDVKYCFAEAVPLNAPNGPVDASSFVAIPTNLREALEAALVRLDVETIEAVILEISQHDANLGRALSRSASHYSYSEILSALQSARA